MADMLRSIEPAAYPITPPLHMAWITPQSIKERLAGAEYNSVTNAALNTGQLGETIVNNELSRIIKLVRGYVGKKNVLGDGDTIPDELENAALALLVYQILTRIPGLKGLLTDERKDAQKEAMRLLRDVAGGDFVIVPPANTAPASDQPAARGTIGVIRKGRTPTRRRYEGLL